MPIECPPVKIPALQEFLKQNGPTKFIFFSSWCSDCVKHLRHTDLSKAVLIAAFDDPGRAAQSLEKMKLSPKSCFYSPELVERFNVKVVPDERTISTL